MVKLQKYKKFHQMVHLLEDSFTTRNFHINCSNLISFRLWHGIFQSSFVQCIFPSFSQNFSCYYKITNNCKSLFLPKTIIIWRRIVSLSLSGLWAHTLALNPFWKNNKQLCFQWKIWEKKLTECTHKKHIKVRSLFFSLLIFSSFLVYFF